MTDQPKLDHAQYRRVQAPVVSRPVSWFALRRRPPLEPGSWTGFRTYSDDEHPPGERLEVEVLLPDATSVVVVAEVAWVEHLPQGAPARFDVGLRFLSATPTDLRRLSEVLGEA